MKMRLWPAYSADSQVADSQDVDSQVEQLEAQRDLHCCPLVQIAGEEAGCQVRRPAAARRQGVHLDRKSRQRGFRSS